jgi:hypothetical protein
MGLSLSWLGVRDRTVSEIIEVLHDEWRVKPWDNLYESPMTLLDMKNGWHVVECYPGDFFSKREQLVKKFSQGTDAIYCSIEENLNYCDAFCYRDGLHLWEIKHHLHDKPYYLITAGKLPEHFDDLQIAAKKSIEDGATHDVMFNVVLEGCRQICGYKANSDPRKLTVIPIPFLNA